ncbi:THUMP-like domain-containing protein [Pontibacter beigongshangensis]|uniref:THUMP-like domain-containing protein n=1 Tax=Pontibacter beigongshangensis TaxID=2574733 RepID=UPI00164F97F8|nr:class I SAM-dependent methyltransferase [Pontibacter beigongshangensis]
MRQFTEAEKQFIQEHLQEDVPTLMLQARRHPDLPVLELVQQIQARQKAATKLPTWVAHPDAIFPVALSVEQSSSETTAAFKASLINGHTLIDLTGGFGVDSFFFARSFEKVLHIEQQQELSEIAAHNFSLLQADNIQAVHASAETFLSSFGGKADVIYLDPARRGGRDERVHLLQDCEPDVLRLLPTLLEKADAVLLKTSPMLDIGLALEQLQSVTKVWVVAVQNECKEVLYWLSAAPVARPEICAINLLAGGQEQRLVFAEEQEQAAAVTYADAKAYVYEPNAAILKAGAYKYLAQQYQLAKLHPNSHLYTSDNLLPDFPGRTFRCIATGRCNKKELLQQLPGKKANITVRNFPETVAEIRRKTGIKEGGNTYLFFTTDMHQKPVVLYCEKP